MKKTVPFLLTLCLVLLTALPIFAETETVDVPFIDEDGSLRFATCEVIPEGADSFTLEAGGWYVASQKTSASVKIGRMINNGTDSEPAHLVMTNYTVLYVEDGIENTEGHCLNLYKGSNSGGMVYVGQPEEIAVGVPGIGSGGTVNMYGGGIDVTAGSGAAGIDGKLNFDSNSFEIVAGSSSADSTYKPLELYNYTRDRYVKVSEIEYSTSKYAWSKDLSECTAFRICKTKGCGHVEMETVQTVEESGYVTATFTNRAFSQQTMELPAPAHEHTWQSVTEVPASCTEAGTREYRYCTECHLIQDVEGNPVDDITSLMIRPMGHDYVHKTVSAKIGVSGKSYDKCSRCGDVINSKTLSALRPAAPKITGVTALRKGFTVKWGKKSYTGYQLRYSTSSSMSSYKILTISKASTVSKKITKLSSKKKYYVQLRTYKNVDGKCWVSKWSEKRSVTTK